MNAKQTFLQDEMEQRMDAMDNTEASLYQSFVKIKYRAQNSKAKILQKARVYAGFAAGMALSVPLCGTCYAALYNWFLYDQSLGSIGWMLAYCMVFALRIMLFGNKADSPRYFNEIKKAANSQESIFDTWAVSDTLCAMLYTIYNEARIPVLGTFAGFIFQTILTM